MNNKNKKKQLLENIISEKSKSPKDIVRYIVRAAPAYQKIFDEVESAKKDIKKSKQIAAAYLKRNMFDLGNIFLFVNKLDKIAFKGQTNFDKDFKELRFTFKYNISCNNTLHKISTVQNQKEKTVKLTEKERKEFLLVGDDQFSRDMALKKEHLDELIGLTREQLNKKGINVNLKYSFTEIHYKRDYKKFTKDIYNEYKKDILKGANPQISRILIRQKKGMRFVSKIDAKETGLDNVPLNIYRRICEEKCNYNLNSGILNSKRKKNLIKNINKYLNNLVSNKNKYYERKILEKFGNIEITPLKKLSKKNLNKTLKGVYNFLKEIPKPVNNTKEDRNLTITKGRENLINLVKGFKFLDSNKKNTKDIINYIAESLFPIRTKATNAKKFKPSLEDLIYPYLNIMLGTEAKETKINYDFINEIKKNKTDRLESKYEKLNGDSERRICDKFGFIILCPKESDMKKILKKVCSSVI